ncbi:MAG: FAD:protein FMN transferase [Lactobacillales bacterium]|jgi:thiamine biosynthesis lipoprotein|nr:FAD:protein FMN transferase [Lactobacillales bacterium]
MKKQIKFSAFLLLSVLFLSLLTACGGADKGTLVKEPYADRQFLLGTYVQVKIYDKGKKEVLKPAFELIKKYGREIDVNDAGGSEIDRVNQAAGVAPVKVDKDIYRLVKKAYAYSAESDGKFDLAIGPITQLWHIGFDDARKPTQQEIDEKLKLVDYQKVILNDEEQTVFLQEKGMELDLGAIAKGFITDEVANLLKKKGVTTAIVDLGGNVYVLGHSPRGDNKPWTVGIQDPNKARNTVVGYLPGVNQSFVTSGIYERYLKVDGKSYHHLMNPDTGYPFDNDIAGVTIVSDKSTDGDGLSTTIFALGLKDGMAFIEKQKGVEALFITKDNKIYETSGIKKTFDLEPDSGYTMAEEN